MAQARQARWNGVDGLDERTRAPYWRIGIRHDLADAARGYDWPRVLAILDDHPDCVNASRPGGRARYAPLHQAAHGGAPASVVRRLLAMGAWRALRTRRGERPVDIARRRGRHDLVPLLTPVYLRRRAPLDVLQRMQGHLHSLIREYSAGRHPSLRLPELEPLLEFERENVYFEVPGMFGGFLYRLEDDGAASRLAVERWSRVLVCHRYDVTPRGWTFLDQWDTLSGAASGAPLPPAPRRTAAAGRARSDREPVEASTDAGPGRTEPAAARPRVRDAAPVLASMSLVDGTTGYVELSPQGQLRFRRLGEGTVTGFDNADVVERHRHPRGIKWMSLNRLMRLREEEAAEQRPRRTPGPGVSGDALRGERSDRRLLEPLHAVPVVSRRKVMVAFVLDMNDQPWRWEESEDALEERLRRYDEELYQQHMQDVKNMEEGDRGEISGMRRGTGRKRDSAEAPPTGRRTSGPLEPPDPAGARTPCSPRRLCHRDRRPA